MNGIIIVGHGEFAKGLLSSIELILGKQSNVAGISFYQDDSIEDLKNKILLEVDSMEDVNEIIFLTDIAGGTPFKTCVLLSQILKKGKVIAGTNLPLLIEILMNKEYDNIDDAINSSLCTAKNTMILYENKPRNSDTNTRKGNGI